MSVTTNQALLELIRKSTIVDQEVLDRYTNGSVTGGSESPGRLARQLVVDGVLTEWQAKFFVSGRHRLKVGSYVLLERLDNTELGDRFLGIHQQLGRKVDIQIFPEHLEKNEELFKVFLDRASQVAELDHPNLLHLYDIDKEKKRYYFVFEHEQGLTLDRIPLGSLTHREIASIVYQALEGLAYAHERGLIHGRLNESQIRQSNDGKVRIRNIGLAELMRQLGEAGESIDEYAIEHQPIDDMITVGVIGRKLVHQHQGHPKTESERQLVALLTDLSKYVPGQTQSIDSIRSGLSSWMSQGDVKDTTAGGQSPAKAPAAAEPGEEKNYRSLVIVGVVAAILVLGTAGYFLVNSLSSKDTDTADRSVDENKRLGHSNFKDEPHGDDKSAAAADTALENQTDQTPPDPDNASGVSPLSNAISDLNQRSQTDPGEADSTTPTEDSGDDATAPPPVDTADSVDRVEPPKNADVEDPPVTTDADDPSVAADSNTENQPESTEQPTVAEDNSEARPPFASLGAAVDLPVVLRNESIPEAEKLGEIYTGDNFLLGVDLVFDPSISRQNIRFELERDDDDDGQAWKVKLSERNNDELVTVGRLFKKADEFWFQWLDAAKDNETVNYFRNCVLKLNTRNETRMLPLRKPVPNEPLVLTEKKPAAKVYLDLNWLPRDDAITIEILEWPTEEFPNQFYEPDGRILSKQFPEGYLHFNMDPDNRFAAVRLASSIGTKIRLDAELKLNMLNEGKVVTFRQHLHQKLGEELAIYQAKCKALLEAAQAYQAPDGEKLKHRERVKQLSAELDRINKQVNEFALFSEVVPKLFDRQLTYRIFYNLEGTEIELVSPLPPTDDANDG